MGICMKKEINFYDLDCTIEEMKERIDILSFVNTIGTRKLLNIYLRLLEIKKKEVA